jgi:hypothetical protein
MLSVLCFNSGGPLSAEIAGMLLKLMVKIKDKAATAIEAGSISGMVC